MFSTISDLFVFAIRAGFGLVFAICLGIVFLKKKVTLYDFLKPTKGKIILALGFLVALFFAQFFIKLFDVCVPCCALRYGWPLPILRSYCVPGTFSEGLSARIDYSLSPLGITVDFLLWYFLASAIVHVRKKKE